MSRRAKEIGAGVGRRLQVALDASGLTIRDLSARTHISTTTIMKIKGGEGGNSGLATLATLAKALGVSPCWLCFGEGQGPG